VLEKCGFWTTQKKHSFRFPNLEGTDAIKVSAYTLEITTMKH